MLSGLAQHHLIAFQPPLMARRPPLRFRSDRRRPLILAPARWWSDNNCRGLVSVAVNRFNWADACACTPFRRWIALSFVRALSMSKQRSRTSMSLPIFHYQCGNCGTRKCARSVIADASSTQCRTALRCVRKTDDRCRRRLTSVDSCLATRNNPKRLHSSPIGRTKSDSFDDAMLR